MPRIKMLRGPDPGLEFPLDEDVMTIGRGRKNNIIIQDNEVSRVHCRLIRVLDDYEIHDLKSTNGTFVNGQKLDEGGWLLSGRSLVELGDSITFEYIPTDVATGTAPPMPAVIDATPPPPFYLVIQQASLPQPEIYLLDRLALTIGRDIENDISLQEPEVSRHHMRLVLTVDGYMIEDLNTMNGTHVNKRQVVQQRVLHPGDLITVGTGVQMWYTDDPDKLIESMRKESAPPMEEEADDTHTSRPETEPKRKTDNVKIEKVGHGFKEGDLEHSVFLAYGRGDWTKMVVHLQNYLETQNLAVFSEQYLTPHTEDWDKAIEQAMQECPFLLAVISEASLGQPYVIKAIRHFLTREKPVLFLQYGKLEKPPMMLQSLAAIPYDEADQNRTFRLVSAEIRRLGNL
jgi:pSer/pThr/pTyr-binding forkhead associated (FHA) protein